MGSFTGVGDMSDQFPAVSDDSSELIEKDCKIAEQVLRAARLIFKVEGKLSQVDKAIHSEEKEGMLRTLFQFLKEYRGFINTTSLLTNVRVIDVSIDFWNDKSLDFIREQLVFVKCVIYIKVVVDHGLEYVLEKKLKKQKSLAKE